jgi:hypothetical protein
MNKYERCSDEICHQGPAVKRLPRHKKPVKDEAKERVFEDILSHQKRGI